MAEFTPITTQEDFDNAIKDRINRLNEKHAKELSEKLGSFEETKLKLSEFEKKNGELVAALDGRSAELDQLTKAIEANKTALEEKDAQIKKITRENAKQRISLEFGFSAEVAERLRGETEEDLRQDAEALKKIIGTNPGTVPPLAHASAGDGKTLDSAFKAMSAGLRND